jgi:hypothetical protein
MQKIIILILACTTMVFSASTAEAAQESSPSGKYNILGLTLGMTAKQAEALITQRIHVHIGSGNGSYGVSSEPGVYVPGRPFVRWIPVKLGKTKLNLFFIEVPRGGGQGPEELWLIDYKPAITTNADKAAFVAHVHKKFGPPTKVFSKQIEYWANKDYVSPHDFDRAYAAVLNLTTYSGELTLTNFGILAHMQSVFNSQRTPQHQP